MVEFFGRTLDSEVQGDVQQILFQIPAFSERGARRRARVNSRIKGITGAEVVGVESIRSGDVPGQTIFRVQVSGGVS